MLLFSNTPSIFRGINLNIYRRGKKGRQWKGNREKNKQVSTLCMWLQGDFYTIFPSPVTLQWVQTKPCVNHQNIPSRKRKAVTKSSESMTCSHSRDQPETLPQQGSGFRAASSFNGVSSSMWLPWAHWLWINVQLPPRMLLLLLMISSPTCSVFPSHTCLSMADNHTLMQTYEAQMERLLED